MSYPVQLSVQAPGSYDRLQLLLRLLIGIGLGWIGVTAGTVVLVLYIALPVMAGIAVSTRGASWYESDLAPRLWRALTWLFAFSAYMLLVTDRVPTTAEGEVTASVEITAKPSLGSALVRLVTSLPSAFVLGLLGIVSWVLSIVAVITILVERRVPAGILSFQEGMVRWQARLTAYHASLVDEYPPFSFEHEEPHVAVRAS